MKYYVLYNSLAGNGSHEDKLKMLSELYNGSTVEYDVTKLVGYDELIASMKEEDVIILCGGDGTINRFVNDTDGIEIKNEILYFPLGTGNDFLRDIEKLDCKEPVSIKKYIEDLPLVEVKGKRYRFINNVGFGIDGYCCEIGDKQKKTSTKPVNYTAIAIKGLLFHYKPTSATAVVDTKEYRYKKVWIAPTMKGRFYGGGMMPTPSQDRTKNNELSVMLFYGKGKLKTLMVFPSLFKGEHIKHKDMVAIHTGKEISVTFDRPAPVQIDGETIIGVTSYKATANVFAKANI
jgi:diacylglycerol kinase family enzyme